MPNNKVRGNMEKTVKTKRNILQVLNQSTYVLSDNWGEMISATALAVVGVVAWLFFPVFGFVLMAFATGFISVGYIKFTIGILNKKNPQVEQVYSSYKESFKAFALRIVMCILTFLWGLLFIIPGIICALNFSFSMSILAEDKNITTFKAIEKSKEMVKGYRDVLLNIYLIHFLILIIVFGGITALVAGIATLVAMQTWLVFVIGAVITLCVEVIILMPYKQICLTSVYLEAKENFKQGQKSKSKKAEKVDEVTKQ